MKSNTISAEFMRIYSYVIPRDFGFAPNPFHGYCTLATCKPDIRAAAETGDIVIGTGSSPDVHKAVFFMEVSEVLTFDEYWVDPRFSKKIPRFDAGVKHGYGDNIYHREGGKWVQERSHHTHEDGTTIEGNIKTDTKSQNVLVAERFAYWGDKAIDIPAEFRDIIKKGPAHRCRFSDEFVGQVREWLLQHHLGVVGDPSAW